MTCGTPKTLGEFFRWREEGIIGLRFGKSARLAIIEVGIYDSLFEKVERIMGKPVKHIILESQKKAAIKMFEDLPEIVPGYGSLKNFNPVRQLTVRFYKIIAPLLGLGQFESIEYHPGKLGRVKIINPHNIDMLSASITGAIECLEGIPYDSGIEVLGENKYLVTITPSANKNEATERLEFNFPRLIPGKTKLANCTRCGVPLVVSERFKWDIEKGTLIDKRTGARLHIATIELLTTVFRELAVELGNEVNDLLVEAQVDWTLKYRGLLGISEGANLEDIYSEYLRDLPVYGRGNFVSMTTDDSKTTIVVENPFQPELLAGSLKGFFQVIKRKSCEVTWESPSEGVLVYTVEHG
ncbi:MAG: hypothetical protein JXA49_09845 [Actinobacteria bacterium]|nr:hypothetical protein [Actinomycetota bacterium]